MRELDVSNVRELEDFLINECMYAVSGFSFSAVEYTLDGLRSIVMYPGILVFYLDNLY